MQATYTYDPLDRRIGVDETVSGTETKTWSVYDGENVYAAFNASGTLLTGYLDGQGVDEVLARTSASGTTAWYLTDDEGSVRDIVNSSGVVIDHIAYDSFGNVTTESNAANGDQFKYDGMQFDQAIDDYYDNARYYDPVTGRFISIDPDGFGAQDPNLYRFTGNGPTNATDTSGTVASAIEQTEPAVGEAGDDPGIQPQSNSLTSGPAGPPSLAGAPYDLTFQRRLPNDQLRAMGVVSGYRSGNTYYYFKSRQMEQQFRAYLNGQAASIPPAAAPQAAGPLNNDPSKRLDNLLVSLNPVFESRVQNIEAADKALQAAGVPKSDDPVVQTALGFTPVGKVQDTVGLFVAVGNLVQNPKSDAALLGVGVALLAYVQFANVLSPGGKAGKKALAPNSAISRIGHTTPWDQMSAAQRRAFQHSYSRHAQELGLPAWSQRNAEALRQQFNNIVGYIRNNGTKIPNPPKKPFNGQSVDVNFYEAEFNGMKYYYYEALDGTFISAGKAR